MSEPLLLISIYGDFWQVRPEIDPQRSLCEEDECPEKAIWTLWSEEGDGYRLLCQRHTMAFFDLLPGDLMR